MRPLPDRRRERGQTSAEYLGLMLVVAAILGAISASGIGGVIASNLDHAVCEAASLGDCEGGGDGEGPAPLATDETDEGPAPLATGDDRSRTPDRAEPAAAAEPPEGFGPTTGAPDPEVPGAPEPPPPGDADGSGEFDGSDPGFLGDVENELLEESAYRGADLFEAIGRPDAARHMRHFLGESGEPLEVDPARMLRDIEGHPEAFREREQEERDRMIRDVQEEAARRYDGRPFSFTVDDRGWEQIPSDPAVLGPNWFYGLGGFGFTHTAAVRVTPPAQEGEPPRVEIDYQVHVFDRYNWDKGKSVDIGPVHIGDEELQELHRAGMAQDFDVYGSTDPETVIVEADPASDAPVDGAPAPTPGAPDGEGGRRDRERERGRDDRREPSDRDREGRGGR